MNVAEVIWQTGLESSRTVISCVGVIVKSWAWIIFQTKLIAVLSVLSSSDNSILLALVASSLQRVTRSTRLTFFKRFLQGKLNDVDMYMNPPARYPLPIGIILKLLKAICGFLHALVKFKHEVVGWFEGTGHLAANDAQTLWIKRTRWGSPILTA